MQKDRSFEILETKERVSADNKKSAEKTVNELADNKCFFINLMSSPGAGKTSTLSQIIKRLGDRYKIGVMEADTDSDVDAETMSKLGVKVIQLHTGGSCHMDADMTRRGLEAMGFEDLDLVFLENIGNLVCPAEFDVGEHKKVMILSVPEGDDKPLKYPLMFSVSDLLLVNKIDTAPIFDFNMDALTERAKELNPDIEIYPVSALNGTGFDELCHKLVQLIEEWRAEQ